MQPRWTERAITVTELSLRLQRDLEPRYRRLEVRGEVTGRRQIASGHIYFTLRDEGAQVSCVIWRTTLARLPILIEDGQKVVVTGDLQLHPPQGRYQLIVARVADIGLGEELLRLEELKRKLQAEGLFDAARKRPLPRFPRRIGLVTALTGAALHDFVVAARTRLPCDIVLCTCRVQGDLAARSIVGALRIVSRWPGVDLVVLTRGGGSTIDLLPFSDERVVRQVAACPVPVVSAIGHEVDISLCDLVADQRAMTPTAAASLVLPDRNEQLARLHGVFARAQSRIERRLGDLTQHLEDLVSTSAERLGRRLELAQRRLSALQMRLHRNHPRARLHTLKTRHLQVVARLERLRDRLLRPRTERLAMAGERLRLLSPLASLDRGWALVRREDGSLLRSIADAVAGEPIDITVRDGTVRATIAPREVPRDEATAPGRATRRAPPKRRPHPDEEPP